MAKNFKALQAKMSAATRERSQRKADQMIRKRPVNPLPFYGEHKLTKPSWHNRDKRKVGRPLREDAGHRAIFGMPQRPVNRVLPACRWLGSISVCLRYAL